MMITILAAVLIVGAGSMSPDIDPPEIAFEKPVRMMADGEPVRVEAPGWAAPCWADVDGDGDRDLLVGQFGGGKIRVFANQGNGSLAAGKWLEAEGQVVNVPGVW